MLGRVKNRNEPISSRYTSIYRDEHTTDLVSSSTVARGSDIDVFIYGINDETEAISRIRYLHCVIIGNMIRMNQRRSLDKKISEETFLSFRSRHAITFVSPEWPYRHVQVKMTSYCSLIFMAKVTDPQSTAGYTQAIHVN